MDGVKSRVRGKGFCYALFRHMDICDVLRIKMIDNGNGRVQDNMRVRQSDRTLILGEYYS